MWNEGMPTPPTSGAMCGIGCNINVNAEGDLFVTKVIPGGPAAFSCEIAVGDVLLAVDGVQVKGDSPDEVAKRIVGPEGVPITITCRVRRMLNGETIYVDKPVTLIRQLAIQMPDRLCEGPVGLGIDLVRLESGKYQVRKLQSGGAAFLTSKLRVGDLVTAINNTPLQTLGPKHDISSLVLGEPFSRVSVAVAAVHGGMQAGAGMGGDRVVHIVRTVVLLGEYLMKFKAYENHLDHAILIPTPPPRESPQLVAQPQRPSMTRLAPPLPQGGQHSSSKHSSSTSTLAGDASCGHLSGKSSYFLLDDPRSTSASGSATSSPLNRSVDARSAEFPEGWLAHLGQMYSPSPSMTSGDTTHTSYASYVSSRASNSVDGMVSRSSTASRDSIAPVVKEWFGDVVDKLRTTDGREATFIGWPHASNTNLCAATMAKAGFVFTPDDEAADKVLCAYCALELAHWEHHDDPHSAHHDSSPGCTFWRKSSTSGQRLSREMFSGYGSPYHSMFRSAGTSDTRISGSIDGTSIDHDPAIAVLVST